MKKYITILFLCASSIIMGQSILEVNTICDNKVNTYWNVPSNDNLPIWDHDNNPSTPMVADTRFLNGLDWVHGNTSGLGYSTDNMFFTENEPYGNMTNVKPLTIPIEWYHYLYDGEDLLPENGWELMLHNLGRYPDNVTPHAFEEHKFTPYIVLYNRYTGILRVFVTYGKNAMPSNAIDGVKIDLLLSLNKTNPNDPNRNASGILRLGEKTDQTLDVNTDIERMSAVAKNPGTENRWYSADFQLAYDPCVCFYPSMLHLEFSFFSETDFGLQGRQITMNEDLTNASKKLIDQDYLGSFEYNDQSKDASNGFIMYKNLEKALNDYLAQMAKYEQQLAAVNEYNAEIKRNKAIINAFKALVVGGASAVSIGVGGVAMAAVISGGATWATDFVNNASDLIEKDTIKFYTLEKEAKKLLGSQFDFFSNQNFKEKPAPTKPTQPTVAYSEMNFKGKLTDVLDIPGPDFLTPGTFKSTDPLTSLNTPLVYKYPIYNDAVGTFALLETPYVRVSNDLHDYIVITDHYWLIDETTMAMTEICNVDHTWTSHFQFKLSSDLKYALNTNLDIKDYTIQLAFVITDSILTPKKPTPNNLGQYNYTDPKYITNLKSLNSQVNKMQGIYSRVWDGDLDYYFQKVYSYGLPYYYSYESSATYKKRTRIYQTDFIPKDAFHETICEFGVKNEFKNNCSPNEFLPQNYGYINDLKIELKILVDIEFNTKNQYGENNKITQIYTYLIPKDHYIMETSDIYPNLKGSTHDYGQYPENLTFHSTNFNGSTVDGCKLNGNTYTCTAKNNIWIDGIINAANGYKVNFKAGNEIYSVPESEINGEVVLEIFPMYDFSHPMPQSTSSDIVKFCSGINGNDPRYRANKVNPESGSGIQKPKDSESEMNNEIEKQLIVELFPNPSTGKVVLRSNEIITDIKIFDMYGREQVYSSNEREEKERTISINNSGMYFVHVTTSLGVIVKQLIIK